MITLKESIHVQKNLSPVFKYTSDFGNIQDWDPGVISSEKKTSGTEQSIEVWKNNIKERLEQSEDQEQTLKSFLAKRIRGGIRRAIDINRGTMRIPEHKLNEMRKDGGKDKKMVAMFFNSIFLSIDANPNDDNMVYQIPDKSDPYNETLLNSYIMSLLTKYLEWNEMLVLSKSYGLDGPKWSANEIATALELKGVSAYVRVSELKKQAVQKLIDNVDHSQVLDYL